MSYVGIGNGIDYKNSQEKSGEQDIVQMLQSCPIPDDQILENLGLFLTSKDLSRILFTHHVYQQIVEVPGIIMEFGTRWGQILTLFAALRGIYEPFNRHRKLVGFDTFAGFLNITPEDGDSDLMNIGTLSVTADYVDYLKRLMDLHEALNPISHIKKFELVPGDATVTLPDYLKANPETIVALAYLDFDLYEPTKACLEGIKDRLVKGSLVVFDELNDHASPGETMALMEVFGLNNVKLQRWPYASRASYFAVE